MLGRRRMELGCGLIVEQGEPDSFFGNPQHTRIKLAVFFILGVSEPAFESTDTNFAQAAAGELVCPRHSLSYTFPGHSGGGTAFICCRM